MSDVSRPFPYRQYTTRRNSTVSKKTSTELQLLSPAAAAGPMIPSPIASLVPTPVPSVVYPPYDTPRGSPAPGSSAPGSPIIAPATSSRPASAASSSILIEPIRLPVSVHGSNAPTTSTFASTSSSSSSSSSANNTARHQFRTRPSDTGARRRRRPQVSYVPNHSRRQASTDLAAQTGRRQPYGVTRDARLALMQENGRVRIGREERPELAGCGCVIL